MQVRIYCGAEAFAMCVTTRRHVFVDKIPSPIDDLSVYLAFPN